MTRMHARPERSPSRVTGVVALLMTSVLWGTTGTVATYSTAGSLAIGAAALGLGGILQALAAIPELRAESGALRRRWPLVLIGAVAVAVYPLAFYSAMHLAGVAIGCAVALASAPLFAGLLEVLVDRSRLTRWWALAAGIGIAGCVLLMWSKAGGPAEAVANAGFGVGLGLLAGLTYAVYTWAARGLMRDGIGRGASMGSVFGLGGLLLMPVLAVTGGSHLASEQNVAVAVYMALIPMFVGYLLFGFALTRVSASTATTVTLAEPAVAALLAVAVVGERLTGLGWVGLGLIGGVLVILAVAPTNARD